jgi:hypothetical protein
MHEEPRNRISGTRRNLGLRSVRSGTRWLAAGAAALTGTFTAFAAHSTIDAAKLHRTPNRSSSPTTPTTAPSATNPSTTSPSTSVTNPDDGSSSASNGGASSNGYDGSQWSYQAPVEPPVQTTQPPVASSGGT